ncbi:MAG: hypothetical protein Q9170_006382 [Blastenia crenularia]
MFHDVCRVAIIGAGPAGVATAKQLLAEKHFTVIDVFEQQASTGGVWNYTTCAPSEELKIPQIDPHQPLEEPRWQTSNNADGVPSKPIFVTPMYDRLESNIPHFLMKHSDDSSLEDGPLFAGHESVLQYLNRYADDIRHLISFRTQVYDIRREDGGGQDQWLVCTKDLVSNRVTKKIYDAVVVASGHHYVPVLPDIPGIREWNKAYPKSITHSKYYRTPDSFKEKKVVVVGNSASGLDIATQISTVCQHPLLNSKRSDAPEFQRKASWKREMPEIAEFLSPSVASRGLRFRDGQVESDIDAIVFCTGYYYSFPFLSSLRPSLIVSGERVEQTYKHLFYIDHPSLAFVGLPYKIIPFRTCEGQAATVARIWAGRLQLPSEPDMKAWEECRIADRGGGKRFHELGNLEDFRYHNELMEWGLQSKLKADDRMPPKWSESEALVRKNIPAIKKAFADQGHQQSKRAKLQSQSSGQSVYSIRAIVGEKPGQYLVDREEARSPDWLPKRNVSKEAIAVWENRKVASVSRKQTTRRRRKRSASLSITIHCSASRKSTQKQRASSKHSAETRLQHQAIQLARLDSSSGPSPPGVTVLVSQHSSLDREQYVLYRSSLTLSAPSSLHEYPDSPFGEPALHSKEDSRSHKSRVKVIPDSQSTSTLSSRASLSSQPPPSDKTFHCTPPTPGSGHPQVIPSTLGVPESISSKEIQTQQQPQANQSNDDPSHRGNLVESLEILQVGSSIAPEEKPRSILLCTQACNRKLIAEADTPIDLRPDRTWSQVSSTSRPLGHNWRLQSPGSAVSANLEDGTSTTQDSASSVDLSHQDANPQSQPKPIADDIEAAPATVTAYGRKEKLSVQSKSSIEPRIHTVGYRIDMSEAIALASVERASPITPVPGREPGKATSFRERLKQMRAASRAKERAPTSRSSHHTDRSPTTASFGPQQPAQASQPNERNFSQTLVQSPSRNSPGQARPTPYGFSQGQQAISPQPSFPPQPQMYMNPEQQTRFTVRPMAVPVDVPLAVRTTPNGQQRHLPPGCAPHAQQSPYIPKTANLVPCDLDTNEHAIGLAMNSRVRDQYTSVINYYQRPLDDFLNSERPQESSVQEVKKLLSRINLITTHPDLDMQEVPDEFSQTSPEDEATWAEESSFKFKFLNHLFLHLCNEPRLVSIVARPGRTLDVIESFLKGRGIAYLRPDGRATSRVDDQRFSGCQLRVSIIPSGPDGMNLAVRPAELVIAFDGTFNARDPQVMRMRNVGLDYMMPAVHLLVYKSAEHVERCSGVQMDETARLRTVISCMTQFRHDVGALPPEDMRVGPAAEEVAFFVRLNGHPIKWSLPSIRSIPQDVLELSQDASTKGGSQSSEQEPPIPGPALKRFWDPESSNPETVKRQRMSPAGNINHVGDSVTQSTQVCDVTLAWTGAFLCNTLTS